ncbi:MAG: hypothetical protein KAI66_06825 [Lentisphaeria bacterium]|nr:hypothetical protein [Lentisphaeria bacterium]
MSNKSSNRGSATQHHGHHGEEEIEASVQAMVHFYTKVVKPYWKQLCGTVGAILLAWIVITILGSYQSAARAEKFVPLSKAEETEDFYDVADGQKGNIVGAWANMAAAQRLYGEAKYAEAATRFELAREDATESVTTISAQLGYAYACEADALKDPKKLNREALTKAKASFEIAAGAAESSFRKVDALLGASRCARLLGDDKAATELCARALTSVPEDDKQLRKAIEDAQLTLKVYQYAAKPVEPVKEEVEEKTGKDVEPKTESPKVLPQ